MGGPARARSRRARNSRAPGGRLNPASCTRYWRRPTMARTKTAPISATRTQARRRPPPVSRPAAAGAAGGAPGCADTSEGLCCPFSWNGVSREQSAPTGPHARLAPHLRVARDTSKLITSGCAVIHSLSHDVIVRHPMFLTPVTRLVPHEILAPHRTPKVRYRAQDTRLGCGVALKNLLAAVTGDPARHQRFEQEGRAVPALSRLNRLRVDPFRCDVLQRRCR